jgi:hypothetical protein
MLLGLPDPSRNKKSKTNLDFYRYYVETSFSLFIFLSSKTDVNVTSNSKKQKNLKIPSCQPPTRKKQDPELDA